MRYIQLLWPAGKNEMTNDQKDAICQLWVEIFGTQEGVGYNCPQGAYDFAEAVIGYAREQLMNEINPILEQIKSEAESIIAKGVK